MPTPPHSNRVERDDTEEWYVEKQFDLLLHRLRHLPDNVGPRLRSVFAERFVRTTVTYETPHGPLQFVALGKRSVARGRTLLTKQPATIEWIDRFAPEGIFWDVGANVGVYSLYAASRGDIRVVAFEPAAINYFLLAANCEANGLDSRIDCLSIALGQDKAMMRFDCTQFQPGKSFRVRGRPDQPSRGEQTTLVLSMDELIEQYHLPCPNYIKIDAPGSTEAILEGGRRLLRGPEVKQLHIEVREDTAAGQRIVQLLRECGLEAASRHEHGANDVVFARPEA